MFLVATTQLMLPASNLDTPTKVTPMVDTMKVANTTSTMEISTTTREDMAEVAADTTQRRTRRRLATSP